ncbi:hypothetical protein CN791_28805 [Salmonella enterica]|nr:hypothetical protein [Salmonella enterica]
MFHFGQSHQLSAGKTKKPDYQSGFFASVLIDFPKLSFKNFVAVAAVPETGHLLQLDAGISAFCCFTVS